MPIARSICMTPTEPRCISYLSQCPFSYGHLMKKARVLLVYTEIIEYRLKRSTRLLPRRKCPISLLCVPGSYSPCQESRFPKRTARRSKEFIEGAARLRGSAKARGWDWMRIGDVEVSCCITGPKPQTLIQISGVCSTVAKIFQSLGLTA